MLLRRLYDEQLSQASYLVGCQATGEALVIDPNRDVEQYTALAASQGLHITAVTETHIHADFVSGVRELAQRTDARLLLSGAGPHEWQYEYAADAGAELLGDGDCFEVGRVTVRALHTPGHTPEHLSFLLTDAAVAGEPMGIFTGDFVFVGDVGRPDLLETAAGVAGAKEVGARQLFSSLRRFRELPDYLQVWPGHGAGSPCGRALGSVPQSTVGYEKRFNWALQETDEAWFVRAVLSGQPDPPAYFARMKRVNKAGPAPLASLPEPAELPFAALPSALEAGATVVDARPAEVYASAHVPGTLNIPGGSAFLTWAGALLPYDRPLTLIADAEDVPNLVRRLRLIGHDAVTGFWTPDTAFRGWRLLGRELETTRRARPAEVHEMLDRGEVQVVDVRNESERAAGHIEGSRSIPLAQLQRRLAEIAAGRPVVLHCQGGLRSAIAASVLQRAGRKDVLDMEGGFAAWRAGAHPATPPQE